MSRKRWRMRFVPGGPSRAYTSQVAVYRAVAEKREDIRLGMSGTREARVYCDDALYEVLDFIAEGIAPSDRSVSKANSAEG